MNCQFLPCIYVRRVPIELFTSAMGTRENTEYLYAFLGYEIRQFLFCCALLINTGVCVITISAAQNWSQLMAIRAFQGFFECTISPGFLLIIGNWYRTEEHPARALFWQSGNAGFTIIANLVTYGIGQHAEKYGGLQPWRGISLFLGSTTLVTALLCFGLLGSPMEVRWLSKEEKRMASVNLLCCIK